MIMRNANQILILYGTEQPFIDVLAGVGHILSNNLNLKYLVSENIVKDTSKYIYCCYSKR